jgi:hypothetical protein
MKRILLFKLAFLACCLFPFSVHAEKKFQWAPITDEDWTIKEDSAKGLYDAAMIFEKITADDRKLMSDKCFYSIYHRFRILSPEGRKWGDVTAPYIHKEGKIERIFGRTVLPDGQEFVLSKEQIYEKEIIRSKGVRVRQKSFSLPAVSSDCIIEYVLKYRLPDSQTLWLIQKDVFLIEGEYVWKFFRGGQLSHRVYSLVSGLLIPNYLWSNIPHEGSVERRPSLKEPKEVVFLIKDIPPFESEPYSPPEDALKVLLHCYYGGQDTPAAYWGNLITRIQGMLSDFTENDSRILPIATCIDTFETKAGKIHAAYDWLQSNVHNTTYDDSKKKFKENTSVDDVIKRGYGTGEDISIVFYDLLREMNIDAKMVYVADRDENYFNYQAKYWQFDRPLVAVTTDAGGYNFYAPGGKFILPGRVPWFNENIPGIIIGDMNQQFILTPASKAPTNRRKRFIRLKLDNSKQLRGTMFEEHFGHFARSLRVRLRDYSNEEKLEYISEQFSEHFPNYETDSVSIGGLDDFPEDVSMTCKLRYLPDLQQLGDRLILKPFNLISAQEMPFSSVERKYSIMFDYAKENIEMINIELPETMIVEALPADSIFSNLAGKCHITFNTYGNALSIQYLFRLNHPIVKKEGYPLVRELFLKQRAFEDIGVILKTGE